MKNFSLNKIITHLLKKKDKRLDFHCLNELKILHTIQTFKFYEVILTGYKTLFSIIYGKVCTPDIKKK